ncbi:MAG: hypothetical protein LBG48_00675 [Rickettsiales bacterium]|jgi:glucan phosphoethanolaminetransferase (alkaline phosphatase superfamily)|nr:hypothetical protein [Rickettsiales bacterium]
MVKIRKIIKELVDRTVKFFVSECLSVRRKVVISYRKCREGDERLFVLLLYWALIPCSLYLLVRVRYIYSGFWAFALDLFFFIFALLDYYFISKAVSKHPEYDTELMDRLKKAEYYNSLSDEEYEKAKKEEKQKQLKNVTKSLLFMRSLRKKDTYKGVKVFLILIIALTFKRLLVK